MTHVLRLSSSFILVIASLCVLACSLRRPATTPARLIEPQLSARLKREESPVNAHPVRLLETQARGHIGRRLLHQQSHGELTEDNVWRWASTPDKYLDAALRDELASNPGLRLVDVGNAPAVAATLLMWHLESAGKHAWQERWNFSSQVPTVSYRARSCEEASPFQDNYPATWRLPLAPSCAAWHRRA